LLISCEENEVLWIWSQGSYPKHSILFLTNEWARLASVVPGKSFQLSVIKHWLIGRTDKLWRKWSVVNAAPGVIFTTLHFLHKSVCLWQAFPCQCYITHWLTRPPHKLWRKWSAMNMVPGVIYKTLPFIPNYRMGLIS
jgi:hypothetical protein